MNYTKEEVKKVFKAFRKELKKRTLDFVTCYLCSYLRDQHQIDQIWIHIVSEDGSIPPYINQDFIFNNKTYHLNFITHKIENVDDSGEFIDPSDIRYPLLKNALEGYGFLVSLTEDGHIMLNDKKYKLKEILKILVLDNFYQYEFKRCLFEYLSINRHIVIDFSDSNDLVKEYRDYLDEKQIDKSKYHYDAIVQKKLESINNQNLSLDQFQEKASHIQRQMQKDLIANAILAPVKLYNRMKIDTLHSKLDKYQLLLFDYITANPSLFKTSKSTLSVYKDRHLLMFKIEDDLERQIIFHFTIQLDITEYRWLKMTVNLVDPSYSSQKDVMEMLKEYLDIIQNNLKFPLYCKIDDGQIKRFKEEYL